MAEFPPTISDEKEFPDISDFSESGNPVQEVGTKDIDSKTMNELR